jgi:hypothetical protein
MFECSMIPGRQDRPGLMTGAGFLGRQTYNTIRVNSPQDCRLVTNHEQPAPRAPLGALRISVVNGPARCHLLRAARGRQRAGRRITDSLQRRLEVLATSL